MFYIGKREPLSKAFFIQLLSASSGISLAGNSVTIALGKVSIHTADYQTILGDRPVPLGECSFCHPGLGV